MKARFLALAAISTVALAQDAQSFARPQTTAPPPVVDIRVTITDGAIKMSPKSAFRGDFARFTLVNVGKRPHTLTFGQGKRGTGVQTGFTAPLQPKKQRILLLFLDYRGKVPYHGSLAADRAKAAMRGFFTVS